VKDIRHLAKETMPTFMIPDAFIHLQEFPVMPNGKIDQKALTITETDSEHRSKTSPCSNSEQLMVSIVEEMTGTDNISVTDDLFHDIGLSSLQAIRLAFLAKAKGLDVNVTSLYEQRSIRAVFQHAEKRCSSYWADGEYDPAKPVAILICGYVYVHPLYDNFVDYFRKYFSIYIFDAFHENFMWKEQISCDILMDEYMDAFRKEVLGKPLNLIMGTCYGADLAIPFAERVRQETGMAHRVLAMDPIYARRELSDEPPYEMNPNEAILEQYRISDTLQKTVPLPTYDGPMIIVAPTDTTNRKYPEYDNVFMTEEEMEAVKQFLLKNEEDWETHFPQVPKYKVPLDHYRFLETPNLPRIDEILTTHWPDIYMCKKMQK
jgi:aryl carrier-like protein